MGPFMHGMINSGVPMLFNSAPFVFFFPIVTISYFLCPHAYRWALLLLASCVFYMWFIPQYILILFLLIIIDYAMGILIERARLKGAHARRYLIVSILATCAVLFFFKYFNFFSTNLSAFAGFLGLHYPPRIINIILPIGLSFHTFQSLSYVIEVYKGRQKAERHLGIYALYVMFYPQLLAGPIERSYNLIPQLRQRHYVEYQRIADGLKPMAWGTFQQAVVADRFAPFVNQVYGDVHSYHGPAFVLAAILFVVQDYSDFSGYCDIAIGSAKVMGFKLTTNFNAPFFSKSIAEYCRRWNITFFSWVKDYIYIPLCQIPYLRDKRSVAIMIAFLFSGLWHGAHWTYVFWGMVFGFYIIMSRRTTVIREKVYAALGLSKSNIFVKLWQATACFFLLAFSLIFYRANSLHEAFYIVARLTQGWSVGFLGSNGDWPVGFDRGWWFLSVEIFLGFIIMDYLQKDSGGDFVFARGPRWVKWVYYYGLLLAMIIWGQYGRNPFIYFQF